MLLTISDRDFIQRQTGRRAMGEERGATLEKANGRT